MKIDLTIKKKKKIHSDASKPKQDSLPPLNAHFSLCRKWMIKVWIKNEVPCYLHKKNARLGMSVLTFFFIDFHFDIHLYTYKPFVNT